MSASVATIDRLRAELSAQLDGFELPPGMMNLDGSSPLGSPSPLPSEYSFARDNYIKNKVMHLFIETVKKNEAPEVDEAKREQIEARKAALTAQVEASSQALREKLVQLQAEHENLVESRTELERMMKDMSGRGVLEANSNDENEAVPVTEQEMEQEQLRLKALQQRKTDLMAKLQTIQSKNDRVQKSVQEKMSKIASVDPKLQPNQDTLRALKEQTNNLREPYHKLVEMKDLFRGILSIHQELLGISIISVDEAPPNTAADFMVSLRLLSEHEIQIGFVQDTTKRTMLSSENNLRIATAVFLTSPMIRGPRLQRHEGTPFFQKEVPPLDDLVRLAQNIPDSGEACRFLLCETLTRITTTQALVQELSLLEQEIIQDGFSTDYKYYSYDSGFGAPEQDIFFHFRGMAILLRLTADCPTTMGSVYVYQIMALEDSEWKQEELDAVMKRVNESLFQSPVEIVRAIKDEVTKSTTQEGALG
jgi:hypothetical protein